jgi:Arc/MetJ family transcription regulator
MMRTTLTLDDDVAATLERLRRNRTSLKHLVNEALRRGLNDTGRRRRPREYVRTRAVALGRVRIASIDNIGEALAIVEGENFK